LNFPSLGSECVIFTRIKWSLLIENIHFPPNGLPHEAALHPPPLRHGTYTRIMRGIQTRDRRRYPTCSLLSLRDMQP